MIGLSVDERRQNQDAHLRTYLAALHANGVPPSDAAFEEAQRDVKFMTLLLYQYSWMLMQAKQVRTELVMLHHFRICAHSLALF